MEGVSYSVVCGSAESYRKYHKKIHPQLGNDMFSAPHHSTGGSLNLLFRVVVIP